jgi:hypothetical protein
MAYAETQSMFCDSLLDDADWLKRYARNAEGESIPDALDPRTHQNYATVCGLW